MIIFKSIIVVYYFYYLMKAFITILILLGIAMVNSHEFSGPLNLKDIKSSTFNLEEENKLVVGTETGQIYVSKFAKNKQIFNYKPNHTHFGRILGIKRLPLTKQFVTVGLNGRILKWDEHFKKINHQNKYKLQQVNKTIKGVAFITRDQTLRTNRRFAFHVSDVLYIISTRDLSEIKNYTAAQLNLTTISRISYFGGVLLAYGPDSNITAIYPDANNTARRIFSTFTEDVLFVSEYIASDDDRSSSRRPDAFVLTSQNKLLNFTFENESLPTSGTPLQSNGVTSINYCKRTDFSFPTKQSRVRLENIILVGYEKKFDFYVWNNITKLYQIGETYHSEEVIKEIQCYEEEVFILTKNGPNDQLITISLQYVYEDSSKAAGYAAFVFAILIAILVAYQVRKQKLQKKLAQEGSFTESKYVELEERVTVSKSYNH